MIGLPFSSVRSHLIGIIGVIAVAGVVTTSLAYMQIQKQDVELERRAEREKQLLDANSAWARWAGQQQQITTLERENTALLQEKLAIIDQRSAELSEQLKRVEAQNAEVREYMADRIPDALRQLLEAE